MQRSTSRATRGGFLGVVGGLLGGTRGVALGGLLDALEALLFLLDVLLGFRDVRVGRIARGQAGPHHLLVLLQILNRRVLFREEIHVGDLVGVQVKDAEVEHGVGIIWKEL